MKQYLQRFLWFSPFLLFIFGYLLTRSIFHVNSIKTPSITGLSLDSATKILSEKNLNLRILCEKEDKYLEEGTILNQTPIPDAKIKPNQALFVTITKKPNLTCPKVEGLTDKEAIEALNGLNLKYKAYHIESIYPIGYCFGQSPKNGLILENLQNSLMVLYISKKVKKMGILPNFKGKLIDEIKSLLEENRLNFKIFHQKGPIPEDHTCKNCLIVDQRPLAGSFIDIGNPPQIYLIANIQPE
ncbi:PASTA domain-containing protein [Candidatus Dependentiae bacterium]|nr:PASTA domain-containing protein [Candidatus Dependentiae bacterium]